MSRIEHTGFSGGEGRLGGMYRNPGLLRLARIVPYCMSCGARNRGDIVAAHSNQLRDGKGRGLKSHDHRIAFLDLACHSELDQGAKWSREQRVQFWEDAHRKTIGWLFENGYLRVVGPDA